MHAKRFRNFVLISAIIYCAGLPTVLFGQFNYSPYLFGNPHTLSVSIESMNLATGLVELNGVDLQSPRTAFTWEWGDGIVTSGFFPQGHTYSDRSHNYIITVIAHYSSGGTDSVQTEVHFIAPVIVPISLPSLTSVTIPSTPVTLESHWLGYSPPELSYFSDSFFTSMPRSSVEYILSVAASVEMDFVNNNVYLPDSNFQQVVLRDSSAGGAYSIWFATPVALGAGDWMFQGSPSYSSLFHEMGHNFTLNFPANLPYGGRIDGNANAIYSECMAQIFQHAAGYEIVNNAASYGLGSDLVFDIEQSLISSIEVVRQAYDTYVASGCPFASWNDTLTPTDETFGTFMTIAYEFCAQAESLKTGYRGPVKRLTEALAQFDSTIWRAYDQSNNTLAADSFRATLMVSALSYAFNKDLRPEFRKLNFPISDNWYNQLVDYIKESRAIAPSDLKLCQNYPNPFNPSTTIRFGLRQPSNVEVDILNVLGQRLQVFNLGRVNTGVYDQTVDMSRFASGVYFCRIDARASGGESFISMKKMVLIK